MTRWFDRLYGLARRVRSPRTAPKTQGARWTGRIPLVLLIGVIGIALSGAAGFAVTRYWDDRNAQAELNVLGDYRRLLLQNALTDMNQMILAVAREFESSEKTVGRPEFGRVIDRLKWIVGGTSGILDGALEIDWTPRVQRRDRAQHELAAVREGLVGYRVSTLGPDGAPVPAKEQDEYFPIFYAHSGITALPQLGVDIRSDPAQREAMERARNGDRLAATSPMEHADSGLQSAVFLFAPVFAFDPPHDTLQDRRRNLEGFIRGAFVPGPLIDQVLRGINSPRGTDVSFFGPGAGPNELPFHVRSSLLRSAPAEARPRADLEAGLHWTSEVTLADARWTMIVTPMPGGLLLRDHEHAAAAAAMVLLLTVAAMTYVAISRRHTLRLQELLAELGKSEEKFRQLSENAQDAIVMADAGGNVSFWNPAAERIFGYKPEEILGRSMHSVLAAERYRTKAVAEYARFAKTGEGSVLGKTLQLGALRKNGTEFPVELSISAVYLHDAWNAIAIARDVTDRSIAAALVYRNTLLHAVSVSAAELLTAATIEDAMPKVFKTIAEAAHVDRVIVIEIQHAAEGEPFPILRYCWNSLDAPILLDRSSFAEMAPPELEIDPWLAPLSEGKPSRVC